MICFDLDFLTSADFLIWLNALIAVICCLGMIHFATTADRLRRQLKREQL